MQAVVIGAGIAGLLSAKALSGHFDRVAVLGKSSGSDPSSHRASPHLHVLHQTGQSAIEAILPGFRKRIVANGATAFDAVGECDWVTHSGRCPRFTSQITTLACTKDVFETTIKEMLTECDNIHFLKKARACGFQFNDKRDRIKNVVYTSKGQGQQLRSDIVVDASGRASKSSIFLNDSGLSAPRQSFVNPQLRYVSCIVKNSNPSADWKMHYTLAHPPQRCLGGGIAAIGPNRWVVTIYAPSCLSPPADWREFIHFSAGVQGSTLSEFLKDSCEPTRIFRTSAIMNRWLHFESAEMLPSNLYVVGDAMCALNPLYGQGMSLAALSALQLQLSASFFGASNAARQFHSETSRIYTAPWMLTTAFDSRYLGVTKNARLYPQSKLLGMLMNILFGASPYSETLHHLMVKHLHMLAAPSCLLPLLGLGGVRSSFLKIAELIDTHGDQPD